MIWFIDIMQKRNDRISLGYPLGDFKKFGPLEIFKIYYINKIRIYRMHVGDRHFFEQKSMRLFSNPFCLVGFCKHLKSSDG